MPFLFARLAPAIGRTEFLPFVRPFSTLRWVHERFPRELETLLRIVSQIRAHGAKTMVAEELPIDGAADLQEENEDIALFRGAALRAGASRAHRLSFFRSDVRSEGDLDAVRPEEVLGYAILKADDYDDGKPVQFRVYESVIRLNDHRNTYVRGSRPWRFRVGGREFSVDGYLYAQQNGTTNNCAHVAMRTATASFHRDGDMSYREMNTLLGIDHGKRRSAGKRDKEGKLTIKKMQITIEEMQMVLKAAGAECDVAEFKPEKGVRMKEFRAQLAEMPAWQEYVYDSIESGWPAIIIFHVPGKDGHAIPAFGHTFNQDMWVPNAEQIYFDLHPFSKDGSSRSRRHLPSDAWLSSFICHDDNLGSNLCVPRHYLRVPPPRKGKGARVPNLGADFVAGVIATRPRKVCYNAYRAENLASKLVHRILADLPGDDQGLWIERLRRTDVKSRIILRTIILESGAAYADHLRKLLDWQDHPVDPEALTRVETELEPKPYWMVEISMPDLFSMNHRKVGEMLFRASEPLSNDTNQNAFQLARVPSYFVRPNADASEGREFDWVRSGAEDHTALYHCEPHDTVNGRSLLA